MYLVSDYLSLVKHKSVCEHAQNAQIQIILRMCKESSTRGFFSPCYHSLFSSDSVSGHCRPWSYCADARDDMGFRCRIYRKTRFRIAWSIMWVLLLSLKRFLAITRNKEDVLLQYAFNKVHARYIANNEISNKIVCGQTWIPKINQNVPFRKMCRPWLDPHNAAYELGLTHTITKTCLYNIDPLKPHFLYSKTGVYKGIHYFSYFCSKT